MAKDERIIEVVIGFNADREEIEYIKSDFLIEKYNYKDPINYTAKLMEMGLEKWIREKIGIFCPKCEEELQEGWSFCPSCGWSSKREE